MKIENLLAPYLYQHKKLLLSGIGIFEADMSTNAPENSDKHHIPVQGITFKQHAQTEPDNELIEFIKARTGKMKPLAMADLESYLMLVRQFLNIGKPFYIEGIGTLQKTAGGILKFTPGEYISTRLENTTPGTANTEMKKKSQLNNEDKSTSQKTVVALATIATIVLIGWGGYYLYKTNTDQKAGGTTIVYPQDTAVGTRIQSDSLLKAMDTFPPPAETNTTIAPSGSYKFVFETTANKQRALYRYNYLHNFNPQIQLEAKADSSIFKIYILLRTTAADTSRIKDSLNAWYYGKGDIKVKIEK